MTQLPPEVFTLIGINLFLVLGLLTYLLGSRFPKALPYIYEAVALSGLGYLVFNKAYLVQTDENTRLGYSVAYLTMALTSIVATNFYLAASKRVRTIAKAWLGVFSFPSILVAVFFALQYSSVQGSFSILNSQIDLMMLALGVGIGLTLSFSPETAKILHRNKEVKQ